MNFDELPFELKEHIFTYVAPNEWINTAKVSKEWLELTLGSIKKVESCHVLILDHLAEFINQQRKTNYSWVSLLTFMPRLKHLESAENTETFWTEIRPICHQLTILHLNPRNDACWNNLDISFTNLVELLWDGSFSGRLLWCNIYKEPEFPFSLLLCSPKLEKIVLRKVKINAEWKTNMPKSVKHILLDRVFSTVDNQLYINNLCVDTPALETFNALTCAFPVSAASKFFAETPRLKNLELELSFSDENISMIIQNAFKNSGGLETVKFHYVPITESWRRVIPKNVRSINFVSMNVQEDLRRDFSLDWLFQNYNCLQSLELRDVDWSGFHSQNFYSTEHLQKLYLDNQVALFGPAIHESMDPFPDICLRMIRDSHLVDVEIVGITIAESWRHIFPSTIRRLKLTYVSLSKEAHLRFSPQFICENPSNMELLSLNHFDGDLPGMDLNAFSGMHKLRELNLNLRLSDECLQSILTHCSALTTLFIRKLLTGALTNIPRNLILPSIRKLDVNETVDQPSLLLQHFPKVRIVDINIGSSQECFSDTMQAMQEVETVKIKIRFPTWQLIRSLIKSIDDSKFKYFCLACETDVVSFFFTDSLLDACSKLNDVLIFKEHHKVLMVNNYPTSPLLRKNLSHIPSSIDELSQLYHELMA